MMMIIMEGRHWRQPRQLSMKAIFLACSLMLSVTSTLSCPRKCQCIWRDSKITVDCSDQELAAIPTTVEANTQVLNISGNNVPLFGRRHFSRLGLTNLQRVSASRCGLVQIDSLAFVGLTNLVELDLALNDLMEVPSDALNHDEGCSISLMSLSLRSNKIEAIRTRAFHNLGQLTKLDLSANRISAIEAGAFEGLKNLQRIYLHSNHLATLSARDLPVSLHGISVHENRWTCDCRLRSFRLWLTQSNVPRIVEPSCHGPRRLLGIHIQSLSLAEFACAPQLSPTSMYLTVPKGKNVSIVCRVASDPVSTITWFFNGHQIHSSDSDDSQMNIYFPRTSESLPPDYNLPSDHHRNSVQRHADQLQRIRVMRHDDVMGSGESRSELLISQTSPHDNGTYYCQAENKAARSVSNFTLHVTDSVDSPTILQLRLEYFIAVAVAVIVILILVLIVVAVLLVRVCKHRALGSSSSAFSDKITSVNGSLTALQSYSGNTVMTSSSNNGKVAPVPTKMPKHIQMGTGFRTIPQQQQKPDLLSEAAHNLSRNSVNTTTTTSLGKADSSTTSSSNQGSYKMAMENIIEDYGRTSGKSAQSHPSRGAHAVESLLIGSRANNKELVPLSVASLQMTSNNGSATIDYPSDFGLPTHHTSPLPRCYNSLQPNLFPARTQAGFLNNPGNNMLLPADEQYPTLPSSFRSPYIHTADSGPSAIVYYPTTTTGGTQWEISEHCPELSGTFPFKAQNLLSKNMSLEVLRNFPLCSSKSYGPIYEDIYSQVNKNSKSNCDTQALERLSQLLTVDPVVVQQQATSDAANTTSSEVSVKNDLKEAPMASGEGSSLSGAGTDASSVAATAQENNEEQEKSNLFQELDDAFNTLDQELEVQEKNHGQQALVVSAPTAI